MARCEYYDERTGFCRKLRRRVTLADCIMCALATRFCEENPELCSERLKKRLGVASRG